MKTRFFVEMLVEVDDTNVHEDEEGRVYCDTTGDSYASFQEFFEHQVERDLQCMSLVPGMRIERKP